MLSGEWASYTQGALGELSADSGFAEGKSREGEKKKTLRILRKDKQESRKIGSKNRMRRCQKQRRPGRLSLEAFCVTQKAHRLQRLNRWENGKCGRQHWFRGPGCEIKEQSMTIIERDARVNTRLCCYYCCHFSKQRKTSTCGDKGRAVEMERQKQAPHTEEPIVSRQCVLVKDFLITEKCMQFWK